MNKNALINMLYAMRAQIDGALFLLDENPEEEQCDHPKEQRINYTTMGGPEHWICKKCQYEFKEDEQ
jgi:hypothetical protein